MRSAVIVALALVCAMPVAPSAIARGSNEEQRASLVTVEGTVRSVTELPGEGELQVVAISVAAEHDASEEITVLLAPQPTLSDIGFSVESGDRCRVRIFRTDDGPAKAHKVLNHSRGTMVKLRTLRQVPLWDGRGTWQGGPCRTHRGAGAGGHRRRGGR
jgi:hypothetical protein